MAVNAAQLKRLAVYQQLFVFYFNAPQRDLKRNNLIPYSDKKSVNIRCFVVPQLRQRDRKGKMMRAFRTAFYNRPVGRNKTVRHIGNAVYVAFYFDFRAVEVFVYILLYLDIVGVYSVALEEINLSENAGKAEKVLIFKI